MKECKCFECERKNECKQACAVETCCGCEIIYNNGECPVAK